MKYIKNILLILLKFILGFLYMLAYLGGVLLLLIFIVWIIGYISEIFNNINYFIIIGQIIKYILIGILALLISLTFYSAGDEIYTGMKEKIQEWLSYHKWLKQTKRK